MSFFHVIGFALKAGHLLLMLCGWIASVISMNWFINGGTMDTKTDMLGDGRKLWLRLWDKISGRITYKVHHLYYQYISSNRLRKNWWRNLLVIWVVIGTLFSLWVFWYMNSQAMEKRKDTLASMCDERARMLQDQFNVSMNHVQAMSILISTFHHGKNPSAIDQRTFARYTERTAFERPLTSGVAYAVRVLHSEREHFEKQQGWLIKRMDTPEQIPVHKDEYDSYDSEVPEPSPIQSIQEEYAPVIFAQDTVAHVVSIDMLSGKMLYSPCDAENFFVIPGSPAEAWEVDNFMVVHQDNMRDKMNFGSNDFIIAIVGNQLLYGGLWLEHALVLQAVLQLFVEFPLVNNSHSHLKVIVLTADSTGNYSVVLEAIAMKLRYPIGTMKHIAIDEDVDCVLSMVDLVIYGSFLENQSFPDILKRGMCFEKLIIAPDLSMIKKYFSR